MEPSLLAIMRVIITSRQGMTPYVNIIMSKLTNILAIVSKNPSNPRFNHYVFESIGALIRFICPSSPAAVAEFENMLFGPFQVILAQDIQGKLIVSLQAAKHKNIIITLPMFIEFTPYVFQLLAQLLDFHTGKDLSEAYIALLDPLLNPGLWEYGSVPDRCFCLQIRNLTCAGLINEHDRQYTSFGPSRSIIFIQRCQYHLGTQQVVSYTGCIPKADGIKAT
jgi:exportin-2 (importin alpha re-exporter)